jgi:hypothetical protein
LKFPFPFFLKSSNPTRPESLVEALKLIFFDEYHTRFDKKIGSQKIHSIFFPSPQITAQKRLDFIFFILKTKKQPHYRLPMICHQRFFFLFDSLLLLSLDEELELLPELDAEAV